jgi:hypothetical protein
VHARRKAGSHSGGTLDMEAPSAYGVCLLTAHATPMARCHKPCCDMRRVDTIVGFPRRKLSDRQRGVHRRSTPQTIDPREYAWPR